MDKNILKVEVSTREYFELVVDFDNQQVIINYFNESYHFMYSQGFEILDYLKDCLRLDPKDYQQIKSVLNQIISDYLKSNVITYSQYRAWNSSKNKLFKSLDAADVLPF